MPLGTPSDNPANYSVVINLTVSGQDPIQLIADKKDFIETNASESERETAIQSLTDYLADYPGLASMGVTKYWTRGQQMTPTP